MALAGVLPEQRVAPGDQVVQIRHHRLVHVGLLPVAGDDVRAERRVLPGLDAADRLVAQRCVGAGGEVDQDLLDLLDVGVLERPHLPEPLRRGAVAVVGGIEQVVEPALRLGEALVLAQVDGDRERHMEEQLPVVDRVGAAGGEVEVLDRIGRLHQADVGL